MESETHKRIKYVALAFLKKKCGDIVANEVKFWNMHSKADAVGINLKRQEIRIVEAKASRQDYLRDKKLFSLDTSYYNHCNYFYIACPTGIIKPEEVIQNIGLLYVDEHNNIEVVKKPVKNNNKLKTMFKTTLKRTCRAMTNDLMFRFIKIHEFVPGFRYVL